MIHSKSFILLPAFKAINPLPLPTEVAHFQKSKMKSERSSDKMHDTSNKDIYNILEDRLNIRYLKIHGGESDLTEDSSHHSSKYEQCDDLKSESVSLKSAIYHPHMEDSSSDFYSFRNISPISIDNQKENKSNQIILPMEPCNKMEVCEQSKSNPFTLFNMPIDYHGNSMTREPSSQIETNQGMAFEILFVY